MSFISGSGRHAAVLAGIVLTAASWPAAAAQAGSLAPAASQRPAISQAANSFSVLEGVYCTSTRSCWAVGYQGAEDQPEVNRVLHWNARKWYRVSAPNPGGSASGDESGLFAVRCLTAKSCWAVGDSYRNDVTRNQALHWNGKRWSVVSTPDPGGSRPGLLSELTDVTCVSSANCWAVGDYGNPSSGTLKLRNEVLHWNGKKWAKVTVPNPAGTKTGHRNSLFAVRCGSSRSCNAVGTYGTGSAPLRNEVLHWNGTRWSHVTAPNPAGTMTAEANELGALACGSATNCWAPGAIREGMTTLNEMLHWNGRSWTKATVPNPNRNTPGVDNELFGGTCNSTRNCWAVGQHGVNGSGVRLNDALHWNGKRWSRISTPNPAGTSSGDLNTLLSVRCPSAANCWAVGYQAAGGAFQQEILFWNGGKWSGVLKRALSR
jgi:hypothetical protein